MIASFQRDCRSYKNYVDVAIFVYLNISSMVLKFVSIFELFWSSLGFLSVPNREQKQKLCLMTQFFHRGPTNLRFVFSRSTADFLLKKIYRGRHIHLENSAPSGGVILKY